MNDIHALYKVWREKAVEPEVAAELAAVEGQEDEILDRFWQDLAFGTGGLRGVLGAGTNRMNVYTVGKATQGLANYLNDDFSSPSVVVGYDSRINSDRFARVAAEVLAANGVKVYLFPELIPTPVVAWAVRTLGCSSGIIITASHNPSKYNGYKCYDRRGYQMTDAAAAKTLAYINACDIFEDVKRLDIEAAKAEGLVEILPASFLDPYFALVKQCAVEPGAAAGSDLSVIYTPLNGTGNKPVRRILRETGFADVTVVPSQENPDGRFPTCPFPNPEIREAFNEALALAETKKADLLLATDPDCDRVGIAVRCGDGYKLVTGNDVCCLLTDDILSRRAAHGVLPAKPVVIKSIVSTDMSAAIAESYGAEVENVLTGFKYIGEVILNLEKKGEENRYLFGFEESYGYLSGTYVRDKDAVVASMLIAEMAAYYKKQGKSLAEIIDGMYAEYGYYLNQTFAFEFEGAAGMQKMADMMEGVRKDIPQEIAGYKTVKVSDYLLKKETDLVTGATADITLPTSNVIAVNLENDNAVIFRPSGTEPKIKLYVTAVGKDKDDAMAVCQSLVKSAEKILGL